MARHFSTGAGEALIALPCKFYEPLNFQSRHSKEFIVNLMDYRNRMSDFAPVIHAQMRHARQYAAMLFAPLALAVSLLLPQPVQAQFGSAALLADQPVGISNIPGNLVIALSNEYPTNQNDANWGNYYDTVNYTGYFDPNKCYVYQLNAPQPGQSYFKPVTHAGGPNRHFCDIDSLSSAGSNISLFTSKSRSSGLWSGNFLNWATMQTIDPVRATLTGGYRVVDRASVNDPMPDGSTGAGTPLTVLEKAWNDQFYLNRPSSQMRGTQVIQSWWAAYAVQYTFPKEMVGKLTPFGEWIKAKWKRNPNGGAPSAASPTVDGGFYTFINAMGNRMQFSPVDSTLWYPLELHTLWDPTNATTLSDSAYNLDLMNGGAGQTYPTAGVWWYWAATPPLDEWTQNATRTFKGPALNFPPGYVPGAAINNNLSSPLCSNDSNPYPCYQVYVRVSVCDNSVGLDGQSLLESNCVLYPKDAKGNNSPHYKPEGLIQKYSGQLRYSLFSYPWDASSNTILMRAPMRFIGQTVPSPDPAVGPTSNAFNEWDPDTGVIPVNPDPSMWNEVVFAAGGYGGVRPGEPSTLTNYGNNPGGWTTKTPVNNIYYPTDNKRVSGFLNFFNKYGEYYGYTQDHSYKIWDIVDDLYYAALRYYGNQTNPWDGPKASIAPAAGLPSSVSNNAWVDSNYSVHVGIDGFPFKVKWDDPILYRCQKNFILGISDAHTWNGNTTGNYGDIYDLDRNQINSKNQVFTWLSRALNLEGLSNTKAGNAASEQWTWPSNAGQPPTLTWPQWDGNAVMGTTGSYYTAGLAYYMHVNDLRPEKNPDGSVNPTGLLDIGKLSGKVTVDTYWVDVTEFNAIEHLSPYILAAKYGGFNVPAGFDPATAASLPQSWWNTTGDVLNTHLRGDPTAYTGGVQSGTTVSSGDAAKTPVVCDNNTISCNVTVSKGSYPRPDNFFTASDSAKMSASLEKAFSNMVSATKLYTTAAALASSTVAAGGSGSYAALYNPASWTGTIIGSNQTVILGNPSTVSLAQQWSTDGTLTTQLRTQPAYDSDNGTTITHHDAYYGWDTDRRVVTWNGVKGVPFRWGSLTGAQQTALYPLTYANQSVTLPGGGADYVNYLRGDRTNEVNANIAGGAKALRQRTLLLGDIVDSPLVVVGAPQMMFSEVYNPGYAAFKIAKTGRTPMVYAGANDGMLHAFNGDLHPFDPTSPTGGKGGTEAFAYVPSAMFNTLPAGAPGGNATAPNNPLAWLGNPNYVHRYAVNARPLAMDVDFDRTGQAAPLTGTPDWHTILIGGLGKGGQSFYALDVTDPDSMAADESVAASKVLWEFSAPDKGYSYGVPIVVKTTEYGWVVALTSGYDNADGYGHLYLLNPKTGELLKKISTPLPSGGLTQASAYVDSYYSYTADAIYAGDLDGQLWRFDMTHLAATPTLLATLTDASGAAQPVTTWPLIEVDPNTGKRFVLLGTGRLLGGSDVNSTQLQDFYAIIDGTADAFSAPAVPITRDKLTQLKDLTVPTTLGPSSQGWYVDLGNPNTNYIPSNSTAKATTSATGERVLIPAVAYDGAVAFTTRLTTTDPCLPGVSNVYLINFGTGQSLLNNNATYLPWTNNITGLAFVNVPGSGIGLQIEDQGGNVKVPRTPLGGGTSTTKILNWRDVPVNGN
jgi:type IV pilus assembly protein PilY1